MILYNFCHMSSVMGTTQTDIHISFCRKTTLTKHLRRGHNISSAGTGSDLDDGSSDAGESTASPLRQTPFAIEGRPAISGYDVGLWKMNSGSQIPPFATSGMAMAPSIKNEDSAYTADIAFPPGMSQDSYVGGFPHHVGAQQIQDLRRSSIGGFPMMAVQVNQSVQMNQRRNQTVPQIFTHDIQRSQSDSSVSRQWVQVNQDGTTSSPDGSAPSTATLEATPRTTSDVTCTSPTVMQQPYGSEPCGSHSCKNQQDYFSEQAHGNGPPVHINGSQIYFMPQCQSQQYQVYQGPQAETMQFQTYDIPMQPQLSIHPNFQHQMHQSQEQQFRESLSSPMNHLHLQSPDQHQMASQDQTHMSVDPHAVPYQMDDYSQAIYRDPIPVPTPQVNTASYASGFGYTTYEWEDILKKNTDPHMIMPSERVGNWAQ